MKEKTTNTICKVLLEPKKSLDEFGENAIFQPWKFMDVPADELQESDVIAFLCDGDIGGLIVITNKARIYKFNWGEWDYERVCTFCGSRALGSPLISPDKKIIHEKNWESEYMGFGSFLFMEREWYDRFKALEEETNSTEFVLTLWPDLLLYLLTHQDI